MAMSVPIAVAFTVALAVAAAAIEAPLAMYTEPVAVADAVTARAFTEPLPATLLAERMKLAAALTFVPFGTGIGKFCGLKRERAEETPPAPPERSDAGLWAVGERDTHRSEWYATWDF